MKTRNGFVSNSSSSSFVVAFPRKPKNAKEVQTILFGDEKELPDPWDDDKRISTSAVAKRVWNDMKIQKPNKHGNILSAVDGGWVPGYPDMETFRKIPSGDEPTEVIYGGTSVLSTIVVPEYDWEEFSAACNKRSREFVDTFLGNVGDKAYVYTFNYGDENGDGDLENGGIFDRLPHKKISRH